MEKRSKKILITLGCAILTVGLIMGLLIGIIYGRKTSPMSVNISSWSEMRKRIPEAYFLPYSYEGTVYEKGELTYNGSLSTAKQAQEKYYDRITGYSLTYSNPSDNNRGYKISSNFKTKSITVSKLENYDKSIVHKSTVESDSTLTFYRCVSSMTVNEISCYAITLHFTLSGQYFYISAAVEATDESIENTTDTLLEICDQVKVDFVKYKESLSSIKA